MTVFFLFLTINLTPKTIFIVLDLWRWLVVMGEVWIALLGLIFWNVVVAGLVGSMIILPVINCCEHATFFTSGRALGACLTGQHWSSSRILFCVPHAFRPEDWSPPLVTTAPWSLNGDIALTMALTGSVG